LEVSSFILNCFLKDVSETRNLRIELMSFDLSQLDLVAKGESTKTEEPTPQKQKLVIRAKHELEVSAFLFRNSVLKSHEERRKMSDHSLSLLMKTPEPLTLIPTPQKTPISSPLP